jgi:hypothetical protein
LTLANFAGSSAARDSKHRIVLAQSHDFRPVRAHDRQLADGMLPEINDIG